MTIHEFINELMNVSIVISAAIGATGCFLIIKCDGFIRGVPKWMIVLLGIILVYFSALYIFVILTPTGIYDAVWFGRTFIRPANVILFGIIASIIWTKSLWVKRNRKNDC